MLKRGLGRLDRLGALIGRVALVRAPVEELGAPIERQAVAEAERLLVERRRLPVRTDRRSAFGRDRREEENSLLVTRSERVVRHTRRIGLTVRRIQQRCERPLMEAQTSLR